MREEPLSTVEREFILAALREGRRGDGRGVGDGRTLQITLGPALGVAEVVLGGATRVVAATAAELVAPAPDRPTEGFFSFTADLSPLASPSFDDSNWAAERGVDVTRVVERSVRQARALDVEGLCVVAGRSVWAVRVDAHVLDNGGNLTDAASIATAAALLHYRRPEVTVGGDDGASVVLHSAEERAPVPLTLHHIPISTTFALFDEDSTLLDPTCREELAAAGSLSITANKHREICGVHKAGSGGVALNPQTVLRCTDIAINRAAQVTNAIFAALKQSSQLPASQVASDFAKLLELPLDTARLGACRGTDLDTLCKHELPFPRDLCIASDLSLLIPPPPQQHQQTEEQDEELLRWTPPVQQTPQQQLVQQQQHTGLGVSWLRKPEYLEAETAARSRERSLALAAAQEQQQQQQQQQQAAAAGLGGSATEAATAVSEQIRAIEETFTAARNIAPVNPRDPAMAAVAVLPLLPAFELLPTTYDILSVEADPLDGDADRATLANRALIKGFSTTQGDTFVAYLVPCGRSTRPGEQEYRWVQAFRYAFIEDQSAKVGVVVDGTAARFFDINQRVLFTKPHDRQQIENVRRYPRPARVVAVQVPMSEQERSQRDEVTERLLRPAADAVLLRRAEVDQEQEQH